MRNFEKIRKIPRNLIPWKKYWAEVAVLVCVTVMLGLFVAQKEGYHMDELLSFELSNAEFNPWIVSTQPVGRLAKFVQEELKGDSIGETLSNLADIVEDVLKNRGQSKLLQYKADVYPEPVWITAGQFQDYLTVGADDGFNYLSVYFNVKDDNHPPLHFMLLHTMSSLFPGVVAPFLGCTVNILAVLGCILCFFRLGRLLESFGLLPVGDGKIWGICAGLLYGFSCGAISTALLIRMYGVMTFLCVLLFYLHVKKWLENGFGRKNKGLIAVTVLGFLTQYFFLFFCLTLAAVTALLLFAQKRYRELVRYIRTMVWAAVIGVVLFPFSIQDVFSSGRGVEAIENLGKGFSGYGTRLLAFGSILVQRCFGVPIFGVFFFLLLIFLMCLYQIRKGEKQPLVEKGFWCLLLVPCCCYFLLAARMSPYLVDRYIMALFPFAAMIVSMVLIKSFQFFPRGKRYWVLALVLAIGAANIGAYDGTYLYRGYQRQLKVAEQHKELPCICLYDGQGFYYNLMEFTQYEKTLLLRLSELEERKETSDLLQSEEIIVVKKQEVQESAALAALEKYGWTMESILLEEAESVYGDTIYLCVRNREDDK